jgi:hypothetical protein
MHFSRIALISVLAAICCALFIVGCSSKNHASGPIYGTMQTMDDATALTRDVPTFAFVGPIQMGENGCYYILTDQNSTFGLDFSNITGSERNIDVKLGVKASITGLIDPNQQSKCAEGPVVIVVSLQYLDDPQGPVRDIHNITVTGIVGHGEDGCQYLLNDQSIYYGLNFNEIRDRDRNLAIKENVKLTLTGFILPSERSKCADGPVIAVISWQYPDNGGQERP